MASCDDREVCKMAIAICFAESTFGTHYVHPEIEAGYNNCTGFKSQEILKSHKADKNGSWLMKFDSWENFFKFMNERLRKGYFNKNCSTVECIGPYYVGRRSQSWIDNVNSILIDLN